MINNLQLLDFKSYKEIKDYCNKNSILIDLNDEDFQYIFKNILNSSKNSSSKVNNEDQIDPYQYTL